LSARTGACRSSGCPDTDFAMVIFLVLVRPLLERLLGIPPGEGE